MARKAVQLSSAPSAREESSSEETSSQVHGEFGDLALDVQRAYENGTTLDEAEKLAAKFLGAQLTIAAELATTDLDSRMKKNGLKAVKSAVYMTEATRGEKKPSEGMLENHVNLSELVQGEQNRFDTADARKESLLLYFGIFKDAHIYFRGIAKGRFE